IVEPVVDEEMAAEVRDKATLLRPARPDGPLDVSPRLAQPDASNRVAEHDQPPPGLRGVRNRSPAKRRDCRLDLVDDVALGESRDVGVPRYATVVTFRERRRARSGVSPGSHDHGDEARRSGEVLRT